MPFAYTPEEGHGLRRVPTMAWRRLNGGKITFLLISLSTLLFLASVYNFQHQSLKFLLKSATPPSPVVDIGCGAPPGLESFPRNSTEWDNYPYPDLPSLPQNSHPKMPRNMNTTEHDMFMLMLRELDKMFTAEKIPFLMGFGTLLGSYRYHDILPWDDDIDMLAPAGKKNEMMKLIQTKGKEFDLECMYYVGRIKVWVKGCPHAGKYKWRFPCMDIFMYSINWGKKTFHGASFNGPLDVIFPLHRRPLGPLWLLVPNSADKFLTKRYKGSKEDCIGQAASHRYEAPQEKKSAKCRELDTHYPVIKRSKLSAGVGTCESVYVNGTYHYSTPIAEPFVDGV